MKIRRESQEAKRRTEHPKQEAETGSVKAAEVTAEVPAEVTSPPDSWEQKDAQAQEDAGSQGKGRLHMRCVSPHVDPERCGPAGAVRPVYVSTCVSHHSSRHGSPRCRGEPRVSR